MPQYDFKRKKKKEGTKRGRKRKKTEKGNTEHNCRELFRINENHESS